MLNICVSIHCTSRSIPFITTLINLQYWKPAHPPRPSEQPTPLSPTDICACCDPCLVFLNRAACIISNNRSPLSGWHQPITNPAYSDLTEAQQRPLTSQWRATTGEPSTAYHLSPLLPNLHQPFINAILPANHIYPPSTTTPPIHRHGSLVSFHLSPPSHHPTKG